jgi:hypothetical protein
MSGRTPKQARQQYLTRRILGICTRCFKPVDDARKGKCLCSACWQKTKIYYSTHGTRPTGTQMEFCSGC